MNSRLAVGTVQFGLPYGIANRVGQVTRDEARSVLDHAWASEIDTIDTAIAYGQSEIRLGEIGVGHWRVVSKLPAIDESCADVSGLVQSAVLGSLERLKIPKLHGLLLHHAQQLIGSRGDELYRAMSALKGQGMVDKIGISIYSPDELDALWPSFQLDLIQVPFNVLDRRIATSGWLSRLHQAGAEVHARSIFLQGLLLMDAANRPAYFKRWQPLWNEWHRWLDEQALTPLQACLGFALSQTEIDRFVVGVDSLKQLQDILGSVNGPTEGLFGSPCSDDPDLIIPSRWRIA